MSGDPEDEYQYEIVDGEATIKKYTGHGGDISTPLTLGGLPVTIIGSFAYESCSSIKSIIINEGVRTIGGNAFMYCISLRSVTIPRSTTVIESMAFSECTSLDSISLPEGLALIEDMAFAGSALTTITIPKKTETMGNMIFSSCKSMTSIEVDPGNAKYTSVDGVLYDKEIRELIQFPGGKEGQFIIPNSVETIKEFAFSESPSLTSVTIPSSVTTIGGLAFAHCAALTSVIFLGLKAPAQVGEKWIIKTGEDILGYANANSDFPAPGKFFHGLKMSGPSTVRSGYLARKNGIIVEELQQKLHQINR